MAETPLVFRNRHVRGACRLLRGGPVHHRAQAACAVHQGMRAAYRVLRGHGVDLRRTHVVLRGIETGHRIYSGWLTEYSLSIDNLFVFVIIMSNFAVPKQLQKFVLSIGITIALVLRGVFILIGAAIISRFTWVFFLFGAFLIVTAIKLVTGGDEDEEYHENGLIRALRKVIKITDEYDGEKLRTVKNRCQSIGLRC